MEAQSFPAEPNALGAGKPTNSSSLVESPRSTSAGSSSGREGLDPVVTMASASAGATTRDRKFEDMDADLACCDCEADEGPASRLSVSRVGLPQSENSPSNLIVRNTFFDTPLVRPDSLEGFFKEREIFSCPATRQQTADTARMLQTVEEIPSGAAVPSPAELSSAMSYLVQNTFINTVDRPESLEGFLNERQVLSCPATRAHTMSVDGLGCGPLLEDEAENDYDADSPTRMNVPWPSTPDANVAKQSSLLSSLSSPRSSTPLLHSAPRTISIAEALKPAQLTFSPIIARPASLGPLPAPPADWAPEAFNFNLVPLPPLPAEHADDPFADDDYMLRCIDTSSAPGSLALPSLGSALHAGGNCKPCSFVHKAGCGKGSQCPFCHLCDPTEKKRREKIKKEQLRRAAAELEQLEEMCTE